MLRGLAAFALRGRGSALWAVTLGGLLWPVFPPAIWLAMALSGLVALTQGPREVWPLALGSALMTAVAWALIAGHPGYGAALLPIAGLAIGSALLLRAAGSLALALQSATIAGVGLIVAMHLVLPEPSAWWQARLAPLPLLLAGDDAALAAELRGMIAQSVGMMTGVLGLMLMLMVATALLQARAWQAALYNPGAFRSEFHGLRFGRGPALAAVVLLLAAVASGFGVLIDMAWVLLGLFVFQGLAVLHGVAGLTRTHTGWLVLLYALLLLRPAQVASLAALLGLLDNAFDLRARVAPKPPRP